MVKLTEEINAIVEVDEHEHSTKTEEDIIRARVIELIVPMSELEWF